MDLREHIIEAAARQGGGFLFFEPLRSFRSSSAATSNLRRIIVFHTEAIKCNYGLSSTISIKS